MDLAKDCFANSLNKENKVSILNLVSCFTIQCPAMFAKMFIFCVKILDTAIHFTLGTIAWLVQSEFPPLIHVFELYYLF